MSGGYHVVSTDWLFQLLQKVLLTVKKFLFSCSLYSNVKPTIFFLSVKGLRVNILGFMDQTVSFSPTQLCRSTWELSWTSADIHEWMSMAIFFSKIWLTRKDGEADLSSSLPTLVSVEDSLFIYLLAVVSSSPLLLWSLLFLLDQAL